MQVSGAVREDLYGGAKRAGWVELALESQASAAAIFIGQMRRFRLPFIPELPHMSNMLCALVHHLPPV